MKKSVRKFMLLFLVILLLVPLDLMSKKRKKGAELVVYKTDGLEIRGELLHVKMDSLLLMESPTSTGITININEMQTIKIIRKSKFWKGVGIGYGISFFYFSYAALDYLKSEDEMGNVIIFLLYTTISTAVVGTAAALISGLFGSYASIGRTFKIAGKKKHEIDDILKELSLMARFKTIDSPPAPGKKINLFANPGLATGEFEGKFFDLGVEMGLYRNIYGQFLFDYYLRPISWRRKNGNLAYGFNFYIVYKLLKFNKVNFFIKGGLHYTFEQHPLPWSGEIFKERYLGTGTGSGMEVTLSNRLALVLGVTAKQGKLGYTSRWVKFYCGLSYCLNK